MQKQSVSKFVTGKSDNMPMMQTRLAEIVETKHQLYHRHPEIAALLSSQYIDEIKQNYQSLGGDLAEYSSQIGAYDISTENFNIELDEFLHFNRYRQATLASPIYTMLPEFPIDCIVHGVSQKRKPK